MREYCHTFCHIFMHLIKKPLWLLVLVSLLMMSLVYGNHVWKLPVGLVDLDHSNMSRALARKLNAMSRLEIIHYPVELETRKDLADKKIFAVIILPKDTEKNTLNGKEISIQAYGDATNRLPNGLIQKDILSAYEDTISNYNKTLAMKNNWSDKDFASYEQPISASLVELYNAGISFSAIIFPGLVSMILQQSLLVACVTITLGLKRQDGDLMLFSEYMGGVSATFPIWIILSLVVYVILPNILGYRQTADIPSLIAVTIPFIYAVIGLSRVITECLLHSGLIYLTLPFITLPVFFISGTIWPLQAMPSTVRFISYMLPSTWATKAMAGMNQMSMPLADVTKEIIILIILGSLYLAIGEFVYRKRNRLRFRFMQRKI